MATLCLPFADVFPDVDEAHDSCVVRLVATLEAHDGIALAHVVTGPAGAPVRLCVHHDPAVAEADDVRDTVDALSESQRTHFGHVHARVADAAAACAAAERVRRVSGVRGVETTDDGTLHVEYNRDRTTETAVRAAIGEVTADPPGPSDA